MSGPLEWDGVVAQELVDDVERQVRDALSAGRLPDLRLVGFGEISPVIALDDPPIVLKRITGFRDIAEAEAYRSLFVEHLEALGAAGVTPLPSALCSPTGHALTVYCVQPLLDPADLATTILERDDPRAGAVLDRIVTTVTEVVGPRLGLDAQLSNWADCDGTLVFLDLTTPMMRDGAGRDRLDTRVLIRTMPAPLRWPVRRFMAADILGAYHDQRTTLLDLVGNLRKERLDTWVPRAAARIGDLTEHTMTVEEADRYYRSNARLWEIIQRLRQADRWVQRRVLRRTYPYFLPANTAR